MRRPFCWSMVGRNGDAKELCVVLSLFNHVSLLIPFLTGKIIRRDMT